MLGSLMTIALPSAEEGKRTVPGVMTDGQFWANDIFNFMMSLVRHKHVTLVVPLDEEASKAMKKGAEILTKIHKAEKKLKAGADNKEAIAQYRAFEILFLHVLLQVYSEPGDAVGILEDLEQCFEMFFVVKPAAAKKRKGMLKCLDLCIDWCFSLISSLFHCLADDDEEAEPAPIDVLVDVLLGFLAKPSALLRTISHDVFTVFCSQMTKTALDLIFGVCPLGLPDFFRRVC